MRSELRPLDIRNVSLASSDGGVAPTVEQLSVPESLPVNEVVEWRRGIALARGIALCGSTTLVLSDVDMGRDHPLPYLFVLNQLGAQFSNTAFEIANIPMHILGPLVKIWALVRLYVVMLLQANVPFRSYLLGQIVTAIKVLGFFPTNNTERNARRNGQVPNVVLDCLSNVCRKLCIGGDLHPNTTQALNRGKELDIRFIRCG